MPAHLTNDSLSEHQDQASRITSTPRLSHPSTPDILFSRPNHVQNLRNGHFGITKPNSTSDGREIAEGMKKVSLVQHPDSRANILKREYSRSLLDDWLSEPSPSHSWTESPSFQDAHIHQQAVFPSDQPFRPSEIAPHQLFNYDASPLSPDQAYAQHNNTMYQQPSHGVFGPSNSADVFMLPLVSNDSNNPFRIDNGALATGFGQDSYNTHPHALQGEFDFNDSPLYPLTQYAADYSPYGLPQAQHTLPTQSDSSQAAIQQLSKDRNNSRDADLNKKLIEWRAAGMSYKDIARLGNWGLSDSTLRGRHRTLTLPKELRQRKAPWDDAAVSRQRCYPFMKRY